MKTYCQFTGCGIFSDLYFWDMVGPWVVLLVFARSSNKGGVTPCRGLRGSFRINCKFLFVYIRPSRKVMNTTLLQVIIVTSSLMKDMNSKTDLYRANAIRVLCRITDGGLLGQIERYLKQAVVDKNPVVSSAALVSGIHLLQVIFWRTSVVVWHLSLYKVDKDIWLSRTCRILSIKKQLSVLKFHLFILGSLLHLPYYSVSLHCFRWFKWWLLKNKLWCLSCSFKKCVSLEQSWNRKAME